MEPDTEAIVVGAGPAGLAVAACLRAEGTECIVLEQGGQVGMSWRQHYERLHLHTDRRHSELPFAHFEAGTPRYPSRLQFIEYLESYAGRLDCRVHFGERLVRAQHRDGLWEAQATTRSWRAPILVVATGYNRVARPADWPNLAQFRGEVVHSGNYRNGESYRGRRVLVVGLGNSGGEIAIDLHEHGAQVAISVRGPINVIPREFLDIPILTFSILQSHLPAPLADRITAPIQRMRFGDLTRFGLQKPAQGPMQQIRDTGRIPLIDIGTIDLIQRGQVQVFPAIQEFAEDSVRYVDGRRQPYDAVVLATGFLPQVDELLPGVAGITDAEGSPLTSGCESEASGLYFCGFKVAATGMLREIGLEAQRIATAVARKPVFAETPRPARIALS